jgi:hypothetical protein
MIGSHVPGIESPANSFNTFTLYLPIATPIYPTQTVATSKYALAEKDISRHITKMNDSGQVRTVALLGSNGNFFPSVQIILDGIKNVARAVITSKSAQESTIF